MIERRLFEEVVQRLEQMPAVAILGPRQAGKKTYTIGNGVEVLLITQLMSELVERL